jgi:DNA-binding PadR family transcriptional regulator
MASTYVPCASGSSWTQGYLSRLLRSLEAQGLVQTDAQASDGRVRHVVLTPKGIAERATYDRLSDELALSFLEALDPAQRDRLVSAMGEVERLLRAGAVDVRAESRTALLHNGAWSSISRSLPHASTRALNQPGASQPALRR